MECSGKHRGLGVHLSFVRSVTMDKWKDLELEKMKAGGNKNAREFFEDQPDWNESMSIQQRYNTKAAALYRDKILCLAQGKSWDPTTSSAKTFSASSQSSNHSNISQSRSSGSLNQNSGGYQDIGGGYQDNSGSGNNGGYQQFNTPEFKDQKDAFFNKRQEQNASRPE